MIIYDSEFTCQTLSWSHEFTHMQCSSKCGGLSKILNILQNSYIYLEGKQMQ